MKNNLIINIGRQFGSGGREVARWLAEEFGCQVYDRELLNLAAMESGFDESVFKQSDERRGWFKTLFHGHTAHMSDNSFYGSGMSDEDLFQFQSDAIRKAADEGPCIFVGRCADYILRDRKNVVNIFLTADIDHRIQKACERKQLTRSEARKFIQQKDAARASYYKFYTGKTWGNAESYDLCINTSLLGMEKTKQLLKQYILQVQEE